MARMLLPSRLFPAALVILVVVLPMTVARANITGLDVIPSQPTIADSVSIRVAGEFGDGCWKVGPADCGAVSGGSISIRVEAVDRWQPPMTACPLIVVSYDDTCRYGRLPAGDYHVVFTENHTSLRDPTPQQKTLDFTVSDATSVGRTTWSRLKLIYR